MTAPLPPVRRQIVVPGAPGRSFEIFTGQIGHWWPLAGGRSVFGEGGTVAFDGGRLVETSSDGRTAVWSEVLEWTPGEVLRITWHPGSATDHATEVRVRFETIDTAEGAVATLVTLEHHGWERTTDPDGNRRGYEAGWPSVIRLFGTETLGRDS